jgi:hypothetical protein
VPLEVAGELVAYQLLLQTTEDLFCLPEPQTYVLDPLARAFNRLDRDAEWQRVGGFDQHLDCEFHRAPPRMNPPQVYRAHD